MGELISINKSNKSNKTKNSQVTVCTECAYFINTEPNSVREHVWYNHFCTASTLPIAIDPYDGKEKPYGINSLGGMYFSDNRFEHCRDVNNGQCGKYKGSNEIG